TKIVPPMPPNGEEMPNALNSHPPMNAPTMPMMMSPIIPYPVPPITSEARTPATRPTTIQASMLIVSVRERVLSLTERYRRGFQRSRITKKERSDESAPFFQSVMWSALLTFVLERLKGPAADVFVIVDGESA